MTKVFAQHRRKAREMSTEGKFVYTKVPSFDEETGTLKEGQVLMPNEPSSSSNKKENTVAPTLWQEWAAGNILVPSRRRNQAWGRSQAFAVMQMLFWDSSTARHPVEVMYNVQKGQTAVAASKDLQVGELKIAPWVSDLGNLSTDSKHLLDPDRTIIKVTLKNKAEETAPQGKPQERLDVREMLQASSAVAAVPADSSQDVVFVCLLRDAVALVWEPAPENTDPENGAWRYDDKTTAHPYWHFETLTEKEARDRHATINCEYKDYAFTFTQLGMACGDVIATTCEVSLPHITNSVAVAKGDRLYLPKAVKKQEQKQKTRKEASRQAIVAIAKKHQQHAIQCAERKSGDNHGAKRKREAEEI